MKDEDRVNLILGLAATPFMIAAGYYAKAAMVERRRKKKVAEFKAERTIIRLKLLGQALEYVGNPNSSPEGCEAMLQGFKVQMAIIDSIPLPT